MGPVLAGIALLVLAPTAAAATFNVNTTVDHDEDKSCVAPSDCTLRDAVSLAGSADTINVPTGTYTLTQGELSLLSDHIAGSGARSGTKWLVEDHCTSTLTRVARGRVKVRDFGKRRTVLG